MDLVRVHKVGGTDSLFDVYIGFQLIARIDNSDGRADLLAQALTRMDNLERQRVHTEIGLKTIKLMLTSSAIEHPPSVKAAVELIDEMLTVPPIAGGLTK